MALQDEVEGDHLAVRVDQRRQLQDATNSDGSMSTDTIAIVLSVLVGAAGYLVQV